MYLYGTDSKRRHKSWGKSAMGQRLRFGRIGGVKVLLMDCVPLRGVIDELGPEFVRAGALTSSCEF